VSDHQPTDDQPGDRQSGGSPFTRPGFLISAGVVLVIVVLAGFLVFTGGEDDQPVTAPSTTVASTTSSDVSPEGPANGAVCLLGTDDQTVPVVAPDTEWTLIGTVAAPSSAEAGPGIVDTATGVRRCYAQTPTGALFAAANFLAAVNNAETLVAAVDELTAAGPGRDTLLSLARTDPTAVLGSGPGFQTAGFSYLSYTPTTATVSLAIGNTGGLAGVPLTVVWEDEDWKIDLPPDGDVAGAAAAIPSLAGYVPWAGA
jgi:hypothetical protein